MIVLLLHLIDHSREVELIWQIHCGTACANFDCSLVTISLISQLKVVGSQNLLLNLFNFVVSLLVRETLPVSCDQIILNWYKAAPVEFVNIFIGVLIVNSLSFFCLNHELLSAIARNIFVIVRNEIIVDRSQLLKVVADEARAAQIPNQREIIY